MIFLCECQQANTSTSAGPDSNKGRGLELKLKLKLGLVHNNPPVAAGSHPLPSGWHFSFDCSSSLGNWQFLG